MLLLPQNYSHHCYLSTLLFSICKRTHHDKKELWQNWQTHLCFLSSSHWSWPSLNICVRARYFRLFSCCSTHLDFGIILYFSQICILAPIVFTNFHWNFLTSHLKFHYWDCLQQKATDSLPSLSSLHHNRFLWSSPNFVYSLNIVKIEGKEEINEQIFTIVS